MAHYRIRVTLPYVSGLPTDVAVNDISVNIPGAGLSAVLADVESLYNDVSALGPGPISTYLSPRISRAANACEIAAFDRAAAPGAPAVLNRFFTLGDPNPSDTALPGEVALCLSIHGDLVNPGVIKARRRGRIYFGPFCASAARDLASGAIGYRPSAGLIGALVNCFDDFTNAVTADGGTVEVWSTVDASGEQVVGGWCDNAFDTMRSRGEDPTARTTFTT